MQELKIVDPGPSNWQELQTYVGLVLTDCGFATEIEKSIPVGRGKVKVDVFASKNAGYNHNILCECKYWETMIPQTIIHAFRTTVADSGASQGIIISKIGFQKGAYEAVINSNVVLYTWDEFLKAFEMEWIQHVIQRNDKIWKRLLGINIDLIQLYHHYPHLLEPEVFTSLQVRREAYLDVLFFCDRDHYKDLSSNEITLCEVLSRIQNYGEDMPITITSMKVFFDFLFDQCTKEYLTSKSLLELMESRQ
jgi:hypothetical protein